MFRLRFHRIPTIAFALACIAWPLSAASEESLDSQAIEGLWATEGFGSIVEIYPCAEESETVCGRIAWLWVSTDKNGEPRTDKKNPDRDLRSRPLIGTEILREFSQVEGDKWTQGRLYNPDDGRTYGGSIRLEHHGQLELEGCALGLFCRTQTWYRPESIIDSAMAEAR